MHARRRTSGLSALEMVVSTAILVVVLGISAGTIVRATSTQAAAVSRNEIERRSAAAIERLAALVADCGGSTIVGVATLPSGTDSLTFRPRAAWSSGAVQYGPPLTVQWEIDPAETANGSDDDGDGFVDEGRVVWQSGTVGALKRTVLVQNVAAWLEGETGGNNLDDNGNGVVDERGLSFVAGNGSLTVRLTVLRRGADGQVLQETTQAVLRLDD